MKSRSLTNHEFIKVLQLEYLSQKLRAIIYEKPEFKKMSNDIAEKKKEKILELSEKFKIPNIFSSDESMMLFITESFLNPAGPPNFQYAPSSEKRVSYWDLYYLFKAGQKVIVNETECKIFQNRINEGNVVIKKLDQVKVIPYKEVQVKLLYTLTIDAFK